MGEVLEYGEGGLGSLSHCCYYLFVAPFFGSPAEYIPGILVR